jgi:phosphate transport system substrate-binding protein
MKEFLEEYVSEAALGPDGYLAERGLTPLADDKRAEVASAVVDAKKLGM